MALRRLEREKRDILLQKTDDNIFLLPSEKDAFVWNAVLIGPEGSSYEGGVFNLICNVPSDYPFKPPRVRFMTPIFHPEVDMQGFMSLDILYQNWSPAITIIKVMRHISDMLERPNFNDPMNYKIVALNEKDPKLFEKLAREMTEKYAMGGYEISEKGKPNWLWSVDHLL